MEKILAVVLAVSIVAGGAAAYTGSAKVVDTSLSENENRTQETPQQDRSRNQKPKVGPLEMIEKLLPI
ncbi:MAG: hypothetical protein ABEI53_03555 [Candidatus Magasanikbacteria bacterium]